MREHQDDRALFRQRLAQVLLAARAYQTSEPRVRAPPHDRHREHGLHHGAEMGARQAALLSRAKLRKTGAQIGERGVATPRQDEVHQLAENAADQRQHWQRQERQQAQAQQAEPGRPVAWAEKIAQTVCFSHTGSARPAGAA